VAGLNAQSNKLGIISDNISNVNTVGYKSGSAAFETLVTSASTTAYSPGGVLGSNNQLITTQGLLQTTSSPTDIAISGNGFFVVNETSDQTGQVLYTRAGSFTQDASGNFVNTAGLFLQAWPLDRNGLLPGEPGNINTTSSANLASLQTVNVQNLAGTASASTNVSIGANLNSTQVALTGASGVAILDALDISNSPLQGANIIVPTSINSIVRGDIFNVATGANPAGFNYTYGGFAIGRDVSDASVGDGGTTLKPSAPIALANDPFTTTAASNVVTVTHAAHGLATGDVVTFAGVGAAVDGIPAAELNASFVVTVTGVNTFTITTPTTPATAGIAGTGGAGITEDQRPFVGNVLDALNTSQTFLGVTGTTPFTTTGLTFKITTAATGTVTFTYTQTAPNASLGQFNNMNNLADAINNVFGLTARVVGNQLYVGAADATQAVTFTNGSTVGTSGPPVKAGIDWIRELDLADIAASPLTFSSLANLGDLVNSSSGLVATVNNPLGASSLSIAVVNPQDTIVFTDDAGNTGSLLAQLGLVDSLNSAAFSVQTTGNLGPAYDPTVSAKNMASGAIAPQFSRPVSVFDALGTSHSLNVAFVKTAINTWAVEIYAQPSTDITPASSALVDGQVATGTLTFNGDGSLQSVSAGLLAAVNVNWTNGSLASSLTYNWGSAGLPFGTPNAAAIGKTDGLSQFASGYNVSFVNQNGSPVGQLTGISIDDDGFITASYNNGQTSRLYKIPLASFTAANNLQSNSGNSFTQTNNSGVVNLKQAGQSGVGTLSAGSLENSNVELAGQLTDMIVAQRAYQANTKVIQTADTLLEDLGNIIR